MNKYYDIVRDMSHAEIKDLNEAIKVRVDMLAMKNRRTLYVGANVTWASDRLGGDARGMVTKINRTRVVVKTPRGLYSVPAQMLRLEE